MWFVDQQIGEDRLNNRIDHMLIHVLHHSKQECEYLEGSPEDMENAESVRDAEVPSKTYWLEEDD